MAKKKSPESKAFTSSLRQKLNMPEPEQTIQDAWTALEEGVGVVKESIDGLQAATADNEESKQVAAATVALAEGLETVVSAVEAMEELLVAEGLVAEDQLLEPDDHAADA